MLADNVQVIVKGPLKKRQTWICYTKGEYRGQKGGSEEGSGDSWKET